MINFDIKKFEKLQYKFEDDSFEYNFSSLNKVLYYFSFFGNLFSIIFAYFFVQNIANFIPEFFSGQQYFVSALIIVFMVSFELFKRFAFEQYVFSILKVKKLTINIIVSGIMVMVLIAGSFYLSLNGSQRIINRAQVIVENTDLLIQQEVDELKAIYDPRIENYQNQINILFDGLSTTRFVTRDNQRIEEFTEEVKILEQELDEKIKEIEQKYTNKTTSQEELNRSNILALVLITSFMELVILLGVGFHAFYIRKTYESYKRYVESPEYKNILKLTSLLSLLYQNGNKKEGDNVPSFVSLKSLVNVKNIRSTDKELKDFMNLCVESEIIRPINRRRKIFNLNFEQAKQLIEKQQQL